jgi:hypothetical protein
VSQSELMAATGVVFLLGGEMEMEAGGLNVAKDWEISIYPILDLVGNLGRQAKRCGLTEGNQIPASKGRIQGDRENCIFESFSIAEPIHYCSTTASSE